MSEFEGEAFTSTREAQQARQGTCGPGALALRPSPLLLLLTVKPTMTHKEGWSMEEVVGDKFCSCACVGTLRKT
jgi:hypothetical protein